MTALALAITAVLVLVNAFFVIAEYSLVRTRRSRLEAMREEGARGAELALSQLDRIADYISACQVGITMTSIGIGAVGERALAEVLKPAFGGVLGEGAAIVVAAALSYLIITSAHITAGELVPKMYAIGHAEKVIRRVARPLQFFERLFAPFARFLTWVSRLMLRALGQGPEELGEEGQATSEELKLIISESLRGGKLDVGEAGMLTGVFHLHEQEARQVMTPFPAVDTVDSADDVGTALRRCAASGHTRLLVSEDGNPDRILGFVHATSLAQRMLDAGADAPLDGLYSDAPIVPETKPLDDLLADLQRERSSLAVVVDEYGRTAGLVTVEDIVEEVVGEIMDETDPAGGAVRQLANGDWYVRGEVPVTDLEDHGLRLPADSDAYNSVGGLVFSQLGRLPQRGDTVRADGYWIRVESVRDNRIAAVRIRPGEAP